MKYIEICIALILVYAILSILVSVLAEQLNSIRKVRSKMLKKSILQMLNDPLNLNYGYLLINHPLVSSMKSPDGKRSFQYLEASIFAEALIDVIAQQADAGLDLKGKSRKESDPFPDPVQAFKDGVISMNDSPLKELFTSMAARSKKEYSPLKEDLENWYKSATVRMSGWYKRKQWRPTFILGLLVALGLNVDSIHLFRTLAIDDDLRGEMVQTAEQVVDQMEAQEEHTAQPKADTIIGRLLFVGEPSSDITAEGTSPTYRLETDSLRLIKKADTLFEANNLTATLLVKDTQISIQLNQVAEKIPILLPRNIPIGWGENTAPKSWSKEKKAIIIYDDNSPLDQYNRKRNSPESESKALWIIGLLITALMISFGAPFWFDVLAKFVNIRRSGARPDDNPKA
jgi:hypothetical protein